MRLPSSHRQADDELRKREARYRTVLDAASDAIITITPDGTIRWFNRGAEGIFGHRAKEVIGKPVTLLMPERYRELCVAGLHHYLETGEARVVGSTTELVGLRKDGSEFPIELSLGETREGKARLFTAVIRDVTEQRRAEERRARLAAIVESSDDAIISKTVEGIITSWNSGAERIYGYTAEEAVGQHISMLVPAERPDEIPRILESLRRGEKIDHFETVRVTKDGRRLDISLTVSPIRNSAGDVVGASTIARDVTDRKEAERRLREAETRYRTLVEQIPAVTYIQEPIDSDYPKAVTYMSPQYESMLGYPRESEIVDEEHWLRTLHPEDRERVLSEEVRTDESGEPFKIEYRIIAGDGRVVWVRDEATLVRDEEGQPLYWLGVQYDITEQKRAEASLELLLRQHEMVLKSAGEGILGLDLHGKVTFTNPAAARMTGWNTQELLGRPLHDLLHHPKPDGTVYPSEECPIYATLEGEGAHARDQEVFWRKDGTSFPVEYTSTPIIEDDEILGAVVTFRDITERKTLEKQLHQQAFYDSVTGLLARAAFMDRLEQALARASRQKTKVAVLFADLDNLKVINDSLGHKAGDQLLKAVAERLKDCLRPEDTAARIGGDEFTIFVEDLNNITDVIGIAERITEALQPPFAIDEREVFATLSIGIALSNSATERPENLLRYADLAMYRAKHNGKVRYEVFEPSMDAEALERLRTETELRRALARERFRIYYQPVVALENGRIAGMEALVRWEHPGRGLLLPEEFLAVAEETGLIVPIGEWVLREACKQMRVWQRLYPALALTISVNLATSQFFSPEMVAEVLDTTELDPSNLQLEITEGAMTNNNTHSADVGLRGLKDLGVQLAIDDFGMGHSSLSYLKRFPVDFLKIDRSFVGGLGRDANGGSKDAEIVSAMIKLTHALDLKVIAEGVETAEQMACLRDLGSDFAQGNYFSEPLPAGALLALLRDNLGNRG